MGHRKKSAPRRGSLGVRPRKRAEDIVPRIRSFPQIALSKIAPLAFLGYKVGMTHAFMADPVPTSPSYGKEIFVPVTFIETPPMIIAGMRIYGRNPELGRFVLGEAWASREALEKANITRLIKKFDPPSIEEAAGRIEPLLEKAVDVRALLLSVPNLAGGVSQKKPFLVEVALSQAPVKAKYDYLKNVLGSQIRISDIFSPGMLIDVIGVTRGRGFQGVVKRFGVKELPRWHKHRKASRTVASRGSQVGALSTTPQAGQMGYHRRTEFNKLVLMVGSAEQAPSYNPPGGWKNYGLIRSDFIVLKGSVMGTKKRPLILRFPIRPPASFKPLQVKLNYIYL